MILFRLEYVHKCRERLNCKVSLKLNITIGSYEGIVQYAHFIKGLNEYVDDILLAGNDMFLLMEIKHWLFHNFEMKDLGEASYILGIKIMRNRAFRKLSLSQETYINTLLSKFNMDNCNEEMIPYDRKKKLANIDCASSTSQKLDELKFPYASAVGSLMYALMYTRPDIAFAVNILSRFQSNPGKNHWEGVKQVMRYLRRTKSFCLTYKLIYNLIIHNII